MKVLTALAGLSLLLTLPTLAEPCYQGGGPNRVTESLELDGIDSLHIQAGAGDLTIVGSSGSRIEMVADAFVGSDTDYRLSLARQGKDAVLLAFVEDDNGCQGSERSYIDLVVRVPAGVDLHATDGSGDLRVEGLHSNLQLEDGSGNAQILGVSGRISIADGSGKLAVRDIQGEVDIEDGSGDLVIGNVQGDIRVEDGSGDLKVSEVQGDLDVEDGSGDISINQIAGTVIIDDGSGDILVEQAEEVRLEEAGSGSVQLSAVGRNHLK